MRRVQKERAKSDMAMKDRMTPVQAAKELGIRPQMVYGFIKHHRISTYMNPEGKTQLVDLTEVRAVTKGVKPHRAKDPTTGKAIRRTAGVRAGSLVSYHGHMVGERKDRPHRVVNVADVVENDDGQPSLVYTQRGDGTPGPIWESEDLAVKIATGKCHIESPEALLGVLMFHFTHNEQAELALSLQLWAESNGLNPYRMEEKAAAK